MAELRNVDPRTLKLNPDNPRKTAATKDMDQQLTASITAIGLLQPPVVREMDGELVVRAGDRRIRASIAAGLDRIDVYVIEGNQENDPMAAMSENLVRASMTAVDTWRGIDRLEKQGWNADAIANALALPKRTVLKLKLLGALHPPMLDVMAMGSMPADDQLRTIANAPLDDQIQVWKKHKPKKGHGCDWWDVARALSRRRVAFSAARFDEALAQAHGVIWLEDMFAPAGEDSRYTTDVEGFFGAQQEWMAHNLPANGIVLTEDEYGRATLPKGAERVYGKPGKHDKIGHYVDSRSGEVATIAYRMPQPKAAKAGKNGTAGQGAEPSGAIARQRPEVTQKGLAMIGDFRTDALHQALDSPTIPAETLIGLLVLGLAAQNVSVDTGLAHGVSERETIRDRISEGGVLTADPAALRTAAREMLKLVLSCRKNRTDSGISSCIAGETLGAAAYLPSMATEAFLSCLSRQALERSAAAEKVRIEARVKDTRARMVARLANTAWHFPGALFPLTGEERAPASAHAGPWTGSGSTAGRQPDSDDDDPADIEGYEYPAAAE